jgi:hypothetical protein
LNTQGVFTINHLTVGDNCVMRCNTRMQQSAVMEPGSVLLEHTLVFPADRVRANEWRQGWPSSSGGRWYAPVPKGDISRDFSDADAKQQWLLLSIDVCKRAWMRMISRPFSRQGDPYEPLTTRAVFSSEPQESQETGSDWTPRAWTPLSEGNSYEPLTTSSGQSRV